MIHEYHFRTLLLPTTVTAAGVTGGWVDINDLIGAGGRNLKAVWAMGQGATAGTASGLIQGCSATSGVGASTLLSFTNITSTAGGTAEGHFVPGATHRYVRFLGDVVGGAGASCQIAVGIIGLARFHP